MSYSNFNNLLKNQSSLNQNQIKPVIKPLPPPKIPPCDYKNLCVENTLTSKNINANNINVGGINFDTFRRQLDNKFSNFDSFKNDVGTKISEINYNRNDLSNRINNVNYLFTKIKESNGLFLNNQNINQGTYQRNNEQIINEYVAAHNASLNSGDGNSYIYNNINMINRMIGELNRYMQDTNANINRNLSYINEQIESYQI